MSGTSAIVSSGLVLGWVALVFLAFAVAALLRRVAMLEATFLEQAEPEVGPRVGTAVRHAAVPAPALVLFVDEYCTTCAAVVPRFGSLATDVRRLLVVRGDDAAFPIDHVPSLSIANGGEDLFQSLGILVTPFLVGLASDATVALAAPVGSPQALEELAGMAVDRIREVRGVDVS